MKKILSTYIFLFVIFIAQGQEMLGLVNSNYAGVYGIGINPSTMTGSRLYMDYNLLTVQSFFENNYAYWERSDFVSFLTTHELPIYYTQEKEERSYNIFRDNIAKNGFQLQKIIGPSGMLVYKKHAFGLTTAIRSLTSFNNLPPDIAVFLFEAIDFEYQHNINYKHTDRITIASLSWAEVGLSYAYNFHRNRWTSWSAGITLKPLMGITGFYSKIDDVNYEVHTDDSASVYNISFQYGYALPLDYKSNTFNPSPLIKGYGFSADFGITFSRTTTGHSNLVFTSLCEQPYEDYNYRIGFSVLDLGYIKYTKNAQIVSYNDASTIWYKPDDTIHPKSIREINYKIAQYFKDGLKDAEANDNFVVYLPTVLSLQADFHLTKTWYLNGMVVQPLRLSPKSIFRPAIVSVSPRYETARMELSLPLSLYNYDFNNFRLGILFRYGNFFFGFDKVNSIVTSARVTGYDFYVGLRMNLSNTFKMNFIKGYCGDKKLRNIETFDFRNF